jgi:predicted lipid-binding transport protein (Tim44 family)
LEAPLSVQGNFRLRRQRDAAMMHFTMAAIPPGGEVGAAAGIVYGRPEATLPAGSTDAPLYGCSRVPRLELGGSWRAADSIADGTGSPQWPWIAASGAMSDVFDIYTIIFLALAVFIFLRLRSVLGQRTGRERPPYDPYSSARDTIRPAPGDKVVALPGRAPDTTQKSAEPAEPVDRWKGIAETGSTLAAGLDAIAREDKDFDAKHFLTGARQAYDMIVTAYAQGDWRQLRGLLSRDVYDGFEGAIKGREQRGETVETRFVSIDGADITAADLRNKTAQVTVKFQSQLVSVTRDKTGNVIDGNPDKVTDVTDVWTFARDVTSRDPNWKLVATEAGQ